MIDRPKVRQIRERMQSVLEPLGPELGAKFVVGNATFTVDNVRFRVEAAAIQPNGEILDQATADFKRLAFAYGMQPEHLGREFFHGGRRFTVTGLKPRSRRYPVLARCHETGKTFKFPTDAVSRALGP